MNTTGNNEEAIARTVKWILDVVVGHQFCPFAGKVMLEKSIEFRVDDSGDIAHVLESAVDVCRMLEHDSSVETAILIVPAGFSHFETYLDLVALGEELLESLGYEGVFQIASFHPDYCFEGSDEHDAANYTNRSPYPMLHMLREESVEKALEQMEDPEEIPRRNMQYAREKGLEFMRKLMEG